LFTTQLLAQFDSDLFQATDEDFQVGGDIFSDFNEDLDSSQIMEDERFYRYGRFYTVNIGLGHTTFRGNRGLAYEDEFIFTNPSYHLAITSFNNFQTAFILGLQFSSHNAYIDTHTVGHSTTPIGAIETRFFRPFFGFKYYIDTTNLGTAVTYSNPHLIGRIEYWYQTNKFPNRPELSRESGGGLGTGLGFGLEFPMEIKKTYIGLEFLYHLVNYFDKDTVDYAKITDEDNLGLDDNGEPLESKYGFDDLGGASISMMITLNFNW